MKLVKLWLLLVRSCNLTLSPYNVAALKSAAFFVFNLYIIAFCRGYCILMDCCS